MPGFGFGPNSRKGRPFEAIAAVEAAALSLLEPGASWDGTLGSGFASVPSDPARTTAKPACRLLVPPDQFFTDELVVGVAAAANNAGSLYQNLGLAEVVFHFEGASHSVTEPTYCSFADDNGDEVTYLGWWIKLKKPASGSGSGNLYVEAVPADPSMQSRVTGPYAFHPREELHDVELTVAPTQSEVAGERYQSVSAAFSYIKAVSAENPRVHFAETGTFVLSGGGGTYAPTGYCTITADVPVTFAKSGYSNDSQAIMRPLINGLWLKGTNITLDMRYVSEIYHENLPRDHVLSGINITNSAPEGREALWRSGPRFIGWTVRGNAWFLECSASEVSNVCIDASLVRGGDYSQLSEDIFADARCIVGTAVTDHSDNGLNNDVPAMTVSYSGAEATATLERSGAVDPSNVLYTARWGSSSASFNVGNTYNHYAGNTGDGYTIQDVADWLNGLGSGFTATVLDNSRRASAGTLAGLKGAGFGAADCKSAPLTVMTSFDRHGDWFQQRYNNISENVIAYDNCSVGTQTQNIFISSNRDARDFVFFNCAFWNDPVASDYWDPDILQSQLGRNNVTFSHVVIAHCTMANQAIALRTEMSGFDLDPYCLIANNALRDVAFSGAEDTDVMVTGNHLHSGASGVAIAAGTSFGGDESDLFTDPANGNFAPDPQGALLQNLKTPAVSKDRNHNGRPAMAAAGSEG
jgi:hypothetical protein